MQCISTCEWLHPRWCHHANSSQVHTVSYIAEHMQVNHHGLLPQLHHDLVLSVTDLYLCGCMLFRSVYVKLWKTFPRFPLEVGQLDASLDFTGRHQLCGHDVILQLLHDDISQDKWLCLLTCIVWRMIMIIHLAIHCHAARMHICVHVRA
jgi:hypothetical protein